VTGAEVGGGACVRTQLQLIHDWELRSASQIRGSCSSCGHSWKPRNPSPGVNRCPGCGRRGVATYVRHDDSAAVVPPIREADPLGGPFLSTDRQGGQ
jgi:hypothetical protein